MDYNKCFELFNSSYIDKEIKKEVMLNNINKNEDREIIENFVENVFIKYCIKPEQINKSAEENFSEIEIIEININDYRAIYDIYGILLTIIPYPILAIFRYDNRISIAVSDRILSEEKNNKGKIYTSYLIKEDDIYSYLKLNIENCKTIHDIYKEWIFNIESVSAYYERLDKIMQIIEKGFHIKSEEVLEKLESHITNYCGTYNMKPKDGWKSKIEKYTDFPNYPKKIETHILWEYLSENAFLKNKAAMFTSWSDFKESCSYNQLNDIYYSQYNRASDDDIYYNQYNKSSDNDIYYSQYNRKNKDEEMYDTDIYIERKETKKRDNINKIDNNKYESSDEDESINEKSDEKTAKVLAIVNKFKEKEGRDISFDELKNNAEFMLEVLDVNYGAFTLASDDLKQDRDFVLAAIKKIPEEYQYFIGNTSDKLLNDKEFIIQTIQVSSDCLGYANDELKNDENVVLAANR